MPKASDVQRFIPRVTLRPVVHISKGNAKLGTLPNFNLPPRSFIVNEGLPDDLGGAVVGKDGRIVTCPGATRWCRWNCYAQKGQFTANASVIMREYAENFVASLQPDFVDTAVAAIRKALRGAEPLFRLHVSGDFYSAAYARKWVEIAERLPDVHFYVYTKAWRIMTEADAEEADLGLDYRLLNTINEEIIPVLREMNRLPNFVVLLSTDETSGPIPDDLAAEFREAGIVSEFPPVGSPGFRDAVRDYVQTPRFKNDFKTCPNQMGIEVKVNATGKKGKEREALLRDLIAKGEILTCSSCGICWKKDQKGAIMFLAH